MTEIMTEIEPTEETRVAPLSEAGTECLGLESHDWRLFSRDGNWVYLPVVPDVPEIPIGDEEEEEVPSKRGLFRRQAPQRERPRVSRPRSTLCIDEIWYCTCCSVEVGRRYFP